MARKQSPAERAVGSGLVLVDKPSGWTSHDVVGRIRRLAGTRKVGHAGTLDPMATGVLVVGINAATRLLTFLVGLEKSYAATILLGETTTTEDAEGELIQSRIAYGVTSEKVHAAISQLTGDIEQVPSQVSAIKVDGQRAYARARSGEEFALAARQVRVSRFEVTEFRALESGKKVELDVVVEVSSGTYVRALARDLGEALGVGGHLRALRRTSVGPYSIDQTLTLEQLGEDFGFIDLAAATRQLFPARELSAEETRNLGYGRRITASAGGDSRHGLTAGFGPEGELVALLRNVEASAVASASEEAAGARILQAKPELVFAAH